MSNRRNNDTQALDDALVTIDEPDSNQEDPSSTSGPAAPPSVDPVVHTRQHVGYLGPTSFSALFTDNHEFRNIPENLRNLPTGRDATAVTNADIEQGAQILLLFWQCLPLCSKISQRYYRFWDIGVVWEALVEVWRDGALQVLDGDPGQMSEAALTERCREMSQLVWQNSGRDEAIDENTTFQLWASGFTGRRLRWETVGTVCW
jgi:hypothetical protein